VKGGYGMNLWNDIIRKIEDEPWDDYLIRADRWIRLACIVIIGIAVAYFGGHVIYWIVR
jgi:hypothetical protein